MELCKIWVEQCEAARRIEDEFGTDKALAYLVGEKFLNFLEAAETHPDFRAEIPSFAAEVKTIFERWQLAEYLETARQTEPFDPGIYEDDDPRTSRCTGRRTSDARRKTCCWSSRRRDGCWRMRGSSRSLRLPAPRFGQPPPPTPADPVACRTPAGFPSGHGNG